MHMLHRLKHSIMYTYVYEHMYDTQISCTHMRVCDLRYHLSHHVDEGITIVEEVTDDKKENHRYVNFGWLLLL